MKPIDHKQTENHQKEGSKREDKKKTNIRFNSAIFFQVGLIVALIASAWAMNLKINERPMNTRTGEGVTIDEPVFTVPVLEPEVVEPVKTIAKVTPPKVQPTITDIVKVVPNNTKIIETKIAPTTVTKVIPVKPVVAPPVVTPPVKNTGPENINSVEFVPVFPGCESAGDNNARIACMNEKISHFVSRKFDTTVADNTTSGTQRINVQFKIDKNGNIVDIKARAKDKNLEKEAQRVISRLPEFTPGKMGNNAVDVMYMLPINFQLD